MVRYRQIVMMRSGMMYLGLHTSTFAAEAGRLVVLAGSPSYVVE